MSGTKVSIPRAVPMNDGAVLAQVADGDMGALGILYDRYASSLLRFAQRIEPGEAEDIVQTVFLRVIRLAITFEPNVVSARPWLYGITTRVAQERKRALRRWTRALKRMSQPPPGAPLNLSDARRDLDHGLAKLSLEKRTVLVLAEVEGFAGEEIAAMLSIPVGTVWTRLHHARRELRRYHEEERR